MILIFSVLFYLLLMLASGHGFHFNHNDTISLIFALAGISIVPNYKSNRINNQQIRVFILILSMIISIGTIIIGLLVLKYILEFKFGKGISLIAIGFFNLITILFIVMNGILIKGIIDEIRK